MSFCSPKFRNPIKVVLSELRQRMSGRVTKLNALSRICLYQKKRSPCSIC